MPYESVSELPSSVKTALKTTRERRAFLHAYNRAKKRGMNDERAAKIAYGAARAVRESGDQAHEDWARTFSAKQRRELANKGHALPDGSFPIVNKQDLRNAIQAYGRASSKARARRHIMKRARALGATDLLPDAWKSDTAGGHDMDKAQKEAKKGYRRKKRDQGSQEFECIDEACERTFFSERAAEDHALAVHSHNEIHEAVAKALRAKFAGPPRQWAFVVDTADDWFVYLLEVPGSVDDKLFRQGYSFASGEATLVGDPVEVRRRTVYEPIEEGA